MNQYQPPATANRTQSTTGMGIASLVLGIIAIVSSWMPIINNFSFLLAALAVIFGIVGLMGVMKGKKRGKGIAIAGLVLGVVSVMVVLATQSAYSAAIDEATASLKSSSTVTSVTSGSGSASSASASNAEAPSSDEPAEEAKQEEPPAEAIDYTNLAIGDSVEMKDGTVVTVNSVESGYTNYDGSAVVCVSVTYLNNGSKDVSFNVYDWKGQDPDGAQRSQTFFTGGENNLSSGSLASGGTVTGNIYFEGDIAKVLYYGNVFDNSATAAWVVE